MAPLKPTTRACGCRDIFPRTAHRGGHLSYLRFVVPPAPYFLSFGFGRIVSVPVIPVGCVLGTPHAAIYASPSDDDVTAVEW